MRNIINMKRMLLAVMMIVPALVSACGPTVSQPEEQVELTPVNIQLSWTHEYSSSPFHQAVKEGYFAAENLEVTLSEGGFDDQGFIDPIEQVMSGNADFAMSNGAEILRARAEGKPVVALVTVLQRSPLAVISLPDSGISRPEDLIGQTVTVASGGAETVFLSLLESQNIVPGDLNIVERTSFGVDPLMNGEVDALVGWVINEGVSIEEAGYDPQFVLMSDYGVDTYDFIVFTTEDKVANEPEIVQGVTTALVNSLQQVIDGPESSIAHTLEFNPELNEADQIRRLEATIPLMNVPGQQLGGMDKVVWTFTHDILLEQGVLTEPLNVEEVYDLTFIEAAGQS